MSVHAGTLEVPINMSEVVKADRAIAKAMIGNDEIADILPITDRSIYVLGKKMGTTSLTLYDNAGRVIAVMDVAVGPDVEALESQFNQILPNSQIEARISNESIVLTGVVNDPLEVDRAMQLAKAYAGDKVINLISVGSSQQVMLEVRFAEVNRGSTAELGVGGFFNNSSGSVDGAIGGGAQIVPGPGGNPLAQISSITGQFGVLKGSFSLGGFGIQSIINTLETKGLAKTLAQPTLVALSGERASFLAGGEFPIPVAQSGSGGNGTAVTVEFKQFGVSLGFTPTVLGDRTINLLVEPEVSAIDPAASYTVGNISIPGLRTRRASTTVQLRDGESFAIAGLLSTDFQTTIQQIPLLGSIPIIGTLFRSTKFKKGETELLIVITPHLVAPIHPEQVRLPTDRVKDPTAVDTLIMGNPYKPQPLPPVVPPTEPNPGAAAQNTGTKPQASSGTKPTTEPQYGY
ncbi:MAG: type II and III secretion system protein family protein [Novosphingobium sp.]